MLENVLEVKLYGWINGSKGEGNLGFSQVQGNSRYYLELDAPPSGT